MLSIMGEKVRIGIQAPRDIPVFRKEVYLEIQQENGAAGPAARRRELHGRRRAAAADAAQRRGRLAHHVVQRLEHRDGHQDGGRDRATSTSSAKRSEPCLWARSIWRWRDRVASRAPARSRAALAILRVSSTKARSISREALAHRAWRQPASVPLSSGSTARARRRGASRRQRARIGAA